jgi:LysM repeat protein
VWGRPVGAVATLCVVVLLFFVAKPWSLLAPSSADSNQPVVSAQTSIPTQAVEGATSPEAPTTPTPSSTVQPPDGTPGVTPAAAEEATTGPSAAASTTPTSQPTTATSPRAASTGTPNAAPSATVMAMPTPTLPPGTQGYIVKQGDSLYSIAGQFGVTVEEIMKANALTDRSYLKLDQRLVIPQPTR